MNIAPIHRAPRVPCPGLIRSYVVPVAQGVLMGFVLMGTAWGLLAIGAAIAPAIH